MRHAAVELRRLSPRDTVSSGDPGSSLAGINTHMLPDGCVCWVAETKQDYQLDRTSTSTLGLTPTVGPGRWFAATTGVSAYLTQLDWYVNSATGNDANDGATALTAIKTLAELSRRLSFRSVSPSMSSLAVSLSGDFTGQVLHAHFVRPPLVPVTITGTTQQMASGTVTGWTAMDAATSTRAQLTDAAANFSTHVGSRIRLTSGANSGAIAYVCSLAGGNTSVYTTDFRSPPSLVNGFGAYVAPTPGDQYVLESITTICEAHQIIVEGVVSSVTATPAQSFSGGTWIRDIKFVATGYTNSNSMGPMRGVITLYGCEFERTGSYNIRHANSICNIYACKFGLGTYATWYRCQFTELACLYLSTSFLGEGTVVYSEKNIHDGGGTANVSRAVDHAAVQVDGHHRGFFGNVNGNGYTSNIQVQDAAHWVNETTNARTWGAAGNTVTNALKVFNGCSLVYVTKPTMLGATPGEDVVLAGAAAIAWGAVPAIAASPDNAFVNVRH